jgi:predicted thioesterase
MPEVKPGLHAEHTTTVTPDKTAMHLGSGGVDVFATPAMIALMEGASVMAVDPHLDEGCMSVGVEVHVKHLRATPVGQEVRARAEVTEVDGNRLTLKVEAWDETQKIGEGIHRRAIVELERFQSGLG